MTTSTPMIASAPMTRTRVGRDDDSVSTP
jgi:hypothetical protein